MIKVISERVLCFVEHAGFPVGLISVPAWYIALPFHICFREQQVNSMKNLICDGSIIVTHMYAFILHLSTNTC
jgi:hypothetical protein